MIKDETGVWIDDHLGISPNFLADYTERFKYAYRTPRTFPTLGLPAMIIQQDNEILTQLPTAAEIKEALFDINPNKTPGPDGFSAGFFQHYWDLVGGELIKCIKDFFLHGKLLKELNHTFITLIPKIAHPQTTSHFRPISFCSTVYKIISKIMVVRLRPLLDKLVSPFQSALILGRSIHDNILITHEIMHKFKLAKGKTAWVAIKLNMEKVYDKLEWDFLFACLTQMGSQMDRLDQRMCNNSFAFYAH